nr:CBS domain-containing protein [Nitrospirota bacterium]
MSTLGELMRKELKQVTAATSVREAAKRMRDERVGSLFVEKGGRLVGIVTDTDVVRRAVADKKDLDRLTVEQIMSSPIATIEATRAVQDAHDMMGDLGVRHLGVTEGGRLTGLVSIRDLLIYFKRYSEPRITQD